ncbi:26S proteasome regulatory subunit N6 [Strigomonas culicis]|uniref:Probable 26S proteasome regulatory subunit rpn-6.2 n=1 Tax=Strigomonas culicis TaxID=28005 RepID=S9UUX0_9TRYP|nr:26S proteasome regulatory subunit N6 [Strigomonas culicis]EPY32693.1 26S proteasome regulatory subunit N6 [Strigomonas culicis]|eukprot:EPY29130.1 26S proteasome regulatory subunit N6 [Strigomonas culicis]
MVTITKDNALERFEAAEDSYARGDRSGAKAIYAALVTTFVPLPTGGDEEDEAAAGDDHAAVVLIDADETDLIRTVEQSVYRLTEILLLQKSGAQLIALLRQARPFFHLLPKAKTTNMVRKLFDSIMLCGVELTTQYEVCVHNVRWARAEKRTFLRHRLQLRQVEILVEQRKTREALTQLLTLLREVRRLDDRTLLLDLHLLESKIYYSIRNSSKSRAALVSARTTANTIYCPPFSQAEIDLQSGVLHAEDCDHKTAYSYLYEAFEGYNGLGDQARLARKALVYMLLSKIQTDQPQELKAVLTSKSVLCYKGRDLDAIRGIADAYIDRDVHRFNAILTELRDYSRGQEALHASETADQHEIDLLADDVVRRQLEEMYDTLIERHLLKCILPYHRVQLAHIADLLKLDTAVVENRISKLILDKKLLGIVDQEHNCLILFDDVEKIKREAEEKEEKAFYENAADEANTKRGKETTLYADALAALEAFDGLITALFDKVGGKFDALVDESYAKRKEQQEKNQKKHKEEKDAKKGSANNNNSNAADAGDSSGAAKKEEGKKDQKK